jgi:hypothetical protein
MKTDIKLLKFVYRVVTLQGFSLRGQVKIYAHPSAREEHLCSFPFASAEEKA